MQTVEEFVTELLGLPMNAYISVGNNPIDDIEISIEHWDGSGDEERFDFISLNNIISERGVANEKTQNIRMHGFSLNNI